MSLLRRTGTGRNNIDWYNASSNSSGQYLQRISTNRNDISFINISSNGTYNILERYNNSRNSIRWNNTTFSFTNFSTYKLDLISFNSQSSGNMAVIDRKNSMVPYYVNRYLSNGYYAWPTDSGLNNTFYKAINTNNDVIMLLSRSYYSQLRSLVSRYSKISSHIVTTSGTTYDKTYSINAIANAYDYEMVNGYMSYVNIGIQIEVDTTSFVYTSASVITRHDITFS